MKNVSYLTHFWAKIVSCLICVSAAADDRFDIIHDATDTVEAEVATQLDTLRGLLGDCMSLFDARGLRIAALELQIASHVCTEPEPTTLDLHTIGFTADLGDTAKTQAAELGFTAIPFLTDWAIYGRPPALRPTFQDPVTVEPDWALYREKLLALPDDIQRICINEEWGQHLLRWPIAGDRRRGINNRLAELIFETRRARPGIPIGTWGTFQTPRHNVGGIYTDCDAAALLSDELHISLYDHNLGVDDSAWFDWQLQHAASLGRPVVPWVWAWQFDATARLSDEEFGHQLDAIVRAGEAGADIPAIVLYTNLKGARSMGKNTLTDDEIDEDILRSMAIMREAFGLVEPDPPSVSLPFSVAEPVNPMIIEGETLTVDVVNRNLSDVIYRDCNFIGQGNAYSIRHYAGAAGVPHPELSRVRFEGCKFDAVQKYGFWCNGSLVDVLFSACEIRPSVDESPLRIYNGRRVVFQDCTFDNRGESKAAARIINSDQVAFTGCTFTEPLWINQSGGAGGWFGRIYIDDCNVASEIAASRPINIHRNIKPVPPDVPESHVYISGVTSTSERWGKMIGGEEFATVKNSSHNGEPQ